MKKIILISMAFVLLLSFSLAAEVDCGLRGYDGNTIVKFACDAAANSSALKITKNGTNFGILLVDTANTNASKFRIKTSSGVMALKKYAPVACGNGVCESNESVTNCPADCSCSTITSSTSGTCTSCMGGLGSCVTSANPSLSIAPYYLCTHSGYNSYTTWYISSTTYCGTTGWKCTCPFGNGVCEAAYGENCSNDPADCACGSGKTCINGSCITPLWHCTQTNTNMTYCRPENRCWVTNNTSCLSYGGYGYTCQMCDETGVVPQYDCGFDMWGNYTCNTNWITQYQWMQCTCS
ncbi:Uncharacterised protein [uncultured archaeon]|nr:Uncharacterised protein [uncultured archaeon]